MENWPGEGQAKRSQLAKGLLCSWVLWGYAVACGVAGDTLAHMPGDVSGSHTWARHVWGIQMLMSLSGDGLLLHTKAVSQVRKHDEFQLTVDEKGLRKKR